MNTRLGYARLFLQIFRTYPRETLMFFTMNPTRSSRSSGASSDSTESESEKLFSSNQLLTTQHVEEKLAAARMKFGRPFVHEKGSDWKPNSTPFLTRYFQQRKGQ